MSGRFFWDLALQNIRRCRQSYLPYALSCTGTVMMFHIMFVLANTAAFSGVYGGRTIQMTLGFGVWVILVFAVLFMFYTHSFLIKRRKKEFGLFNILGMEKKHLGRVLAIETALTGLASTLAGILLGAAFTRLMFLLLLRMLGITNFPPLSIPESALPLTLAVFLAIHALTLLGTLRDIHLTSPVSLLKGESLGEREPKSRVWLTLFGALCLGAGYGISLTARNVASSIPLFFLAVILVIAGTYALFISGSVTILRALRRNKRFYYQPRHFSVVAGMIHRMKRNAAGLATICILSTMVLVMVSSTLTIFASSGSYQESSLMGREARMAAGPVDDDTAPQYRTILSEETEKAGIRMDDLISYRKVSVYAVPESAPDALRLTSPGEGQNGDMPLISVYLVPIEDYNALRKERVSLAPGEILSHSLYGEPLPERIVLGSHPLRVRENLAGIAPLEDYAHMMQKSYTLVMNRADILQALRAFRDLEGGKIGWEAVHAFDMGGVSPEKAEAFFHSVSRRLHKISREGGFYSSALHRSSLQADMRAFYGGLLFVAIFLGLVFIMAMVLIIYYKQVSEGLEDKARFEIMQKVGMSDQELRRSVKSQVLMVFFIPLVMAGIHLLAAFNITGKVLAYSGLMMSRGSLLAAVSLVSYVCFALFYGLVYIKTSSSYYKIVKAF